MNHKIIDAWGGLLNHNERYRNRDSPRRYFFSTEVMGDATLRTKSKDMNKQYSLFRRNLAASTKHQMDLVRMKDVDLVFFPIVNSNDWCIVVFNLKNPSVEILDNKYAAPTDDDTMMKAYGYVTDILEMMMIKHLNSIGHPAGRVLDEVGQQRLEMDWQTRHNHKDYRIFMMRHMESYMGNKRE